MSDTPATPTPAPGAPVPHPFIPRGEPGRHDAFVCATCGKHSRDGNHTR